jgi:hypothetical protein
VVSFSIGPFVLKYCTRLLLAGIVEESEINFVVERNHCLDFMYFLGHMGRIILCGWLIEKNEMDRTCGAYGRGKRGAQGVGGET